MADGGEQFAMAPLTFQNFLEKMRHPSASELVKSIKVKSLLAIRALRFPRQPGLDECVLATTSNDCASRATTHVLATTSALVSNPG
jgi:hypothetical protein